MTTRPRPHWIGEATERTRPTRLVQGPDATRDASSGGTITHRLQMTDRAINDATNSPTPRPPANKVSRRAPTTEGGEAERIRAARSQGRPSNAQSESPTPG